jgi:transaldolase/glucose-6-phosphate isomerase
VDRALDNLGETELQGKIAIANSKVVYARFQEIFSGERWENLARQGATVQRPLWASTGTKNPVYSDTLYIDSLIGPDTVNTVPPVTLQAFSDHGHPAPTLIAGVGEARAQLTRLSELGVDLESITQKLLADGVVSFSKSYESLIASIAEKCDRLLDDQKDFVTSLEQYQKKVDEALAVLDRDGVMRRIWEHDHTVWKPDPTDISNRLGWLHTADVLAENIPSLDEHLDALRKAGYTQALLLGMGGSSLAPEVFRKTFGVEEGYLDLAVLDSTDPGAVLDHAARLANVLDKTLFIVSTKSGGTVETLSFLKFFYNQVVDALGEERAGEHFIAITDPGSRLAEIAAQYNFRATFLNDANIGGRYSALSYFGMLPAALIGVDLQILLGRALEVSNNCDGCNPVVHGDNKGARLGVILGELALSGRDKVTLITSPEIASFGDWVEQLIAESTGKEGVGILPVVGEPVGSPEIYGDDRLFVYMHLEDDHTYDAPIQALEDAGHPVVRLSLKDHYDLGGQFFLWEMATAVAGRRLGINPFDQPNVEAAKVLARQMVTAYQSEGVLPEPSPVLEEDGIRAYGELEGGSLEKILDSFLALAQPGAYVALQAYVQPSPETDAALMVLRNKLRSKTHLATTLGYGPRFLHSTGQLHKGDAGRGLFIQFTGDVLRDADIPDQAGSTESSISFGTLKLAQVLGDAQALGDAERQLLRFNLGDNVLVGLDRLANLLA